MKRILTLMTLATVALLAPTAYGADVPSASDDGDAGGNGGSDGDRMIAVLLLIDFALPGYSVKVLAWAMTRRKGPDSEAGVYATTAFGAVLLLVSLVGLLLIGSQFCGG